MSEATTLPGVRSNLSVTKQPESGSIECFDDSSHSARTLIVDYEYVAHRITDKPMIRKKMVYQNRKLVRKLPK